MTVFPTAAHLVSWAKWSPQVRQSAGKRKGSNATGRGNPYLGAALGEAAISAGRTQSFLGAKYRRLARRMPKKKALVATGNSMLTIIHALLSDPAARYPTSAPTTTKQRMHTRRQARNHVKSLRTPRLQSHHPGHQPRHRRTPGRQPADPPLTVTHNPSALTRHRALPPAWLRSYFRTSRGIAAATPYRRENS